MLSLEQPCFDGVLLRTTNELWAELLLFAMQEGRVDNIWHAIQESPQWIVLPDGPQGADDIIPPLRDFLTQRELPLILSRRWSARADRGGQCVKASIILGAITAHAQDTVLESTPLDPRLHEGFVRKWLRTLGSSVDNVRISVRYTRNVTAMQLVIPGVETGLIQ